MKKSAVILASLILGLTAALTGQVIIQGVLQQGATAFNGNLTFSPNNTYNIGVSGCASGCPGNIYAGGIINASLFASSAVGTVGGFAMGGDYLIQTRTPTITSGFGTIPAISGIESSFTLTEGTPVGQSGIVAFPTAFQNVPPFFCYDRTTVAANPLTILPTVNQITITGTVIVAADAIDCFSVSH